MVFLINFFNIQVGFFNSICWLCIVFDCGQVFCFGNVFKILNKNYQKNGYGGFVFDMDLWYFLSNGGKYFILILCYYMVYLYCGDSFVCRNYLCFIFYDSMIFNEIF